MKADELRFYLARPIAFHRAFAELAGSATGGLFLSQLFYWSERGNDRQGWIYKTQDDWRAETCLSRSEQERARKVLRELGVLAEDRRGVPARLYYRLDLDQLSRMLDSAFKDAEGRKSQARMQDSAFKSAESCDLSTETTSEITTEKDDHPRDRAGAGARERAPEPVPVLDRDSARDPVPVERATNDPKNRWDDHDLTSRRWFELRRDTGLDLRALGQLISAAEVEREYGNVDLSLHAMVKQKLDIAARRSAQRGR